MTLATPTFIHRQPARILIVDDHPIVRDGLNAVLSRHSDLEVCGEAATIMDALELVDSLQPDLAIIDLSLSDGSGLYLIKRIKDCKAPTKMLVMSMSDESLYAERALRAGAMGYLHKQEAREKLVAAIRCVLAGKISVSEAINNRLLEQARSGHSLMQKSPVAVLSNRELEVLELLGDGLSSQAIADRLHLGIKTVETHRLHIRGKLSLTNSLDLVRFATHWVLENR